MTLEERLSTSLARNLDQLEVSPGDAGAARRQGDRLRGRRRWTVGLAAAACLAVVATGAGVALRSGGDEQLDPAPEGSSWTRLPEPPITPRTRGIAVWTGTEAIFLGGEIDHLCPPNAGCVRPSTYAKDGAAYDPAARRWRTIAAAPAPVAAHMAHAVVGDTLVLVDDSDDAQVWRAYDVTTDSWRLLPDPPRNIRPVNELSVMDGKVYTVGRDFSVQVLDVTGEAWSTLPASPHQPRIDPQTVQATPEGIVVIGRDSTARNDGTVPSWLFAEVYRDGEWRRLDRSDMVGGYTWHWTGERLVSPTPGCVDGGEVNGYGRCIPEGGILDPGTGAWTELPPVPDGDAETWGLTADASGPLLTTYGLVYDDTDGTWTELPRPDDAPDHDVAGVWAEGTLIAFGGVHSERVWDKDSLSNRAWSWTP